MKYVLLMLSYLRKSPLLRIQTPFVPGINGPKSSFLPTSILQSSELFTLPAHIIPLWYYLYSTPCLEYILLVSAVLVAVTNKSQNVSDLMSKSFAFIPICGIHIGILVSNNSYFHSDSINNNQSQQKGWERQSLFGHLLTSDSPTMGVGMHILVASCLSKMIFCQRFPVISIRN